MEEINRLLNYKDLKIVQNTDWFKFSIDSVLLSNFVKITKNTTNIIDFCTGNAPIPLILSTKTRAKITGIEIQKDVYNLAKKSIEINNLQDRIEILNPGDLYGNNRLENLGTDNMLEVINNTIIRLLEETTDIVENRHTGIATMRDEMKKMNLPEPEFENLRGTFK